MASFPAGYESARRFRSAAAHYLPGRPAYADLLIRRVASLVGLRREDAGLRREDAGLQREDAGLQRRDAVLDLGCGPGILARAFAPLAGSVVAMDPEPEMLRAAAEACAGVSNIRLVAGGSDDLGPAFPSPSAGRFRLVAMGRSFHWMDRAETLRRLDALVEPGGAVVLFQTGHAAVPANAWTERFRALRHRYGDSGRPGRDDPSGGERLSHEAILLASAFCAVERHSVFEAGEVDADGLVDRAFSMSGSAPARLGDRAANLERDIRALVRNCAPDGRLAEVIESSALIARRPGEEIAA
jgi:SAM-dependent methyltransferase